MLNQLGVLLWKNSLIQRKNIKVSITSLICPLVVVLLLYFSQILTNVVLEVSTTHVDYSIVGNIPKCYKRDDQSKCITIMYGPANNTWVESIMRSVAISSNLDFETDFSSLPSTTSSIPTSIIDLCWIINGTICPYDAITYPQECYDNITTFTSFHRVPMESVGDTPFCPACGPCNFVRDTLAIDDFLLTNPNMTQNVVLFTGTYLADSGLFSTVVPSYILYYNASITTFPLNGKDFSLEVKLAVDKAILKSVLNESDVIDYESEIASYPLPPPRIIGYDVAGANGGIWFYLPAMITFFVLLTDVVNEKESKFRMALITMGMRNHVFWVSWWITGACYSFIIVIILIIASLLADFSFFVNSNLLVVFLLFFLFALSMNSFALFLQVFISSTKTAQTIGYSFILIGFVFQVILCTASYGGVINLLYSKDLEPWVYILRGLFEMYPPFSMSKIYYDINAKSTPTIDNNEVTITIPVGYTWPDLYQERVDNIFGVDIQVPATSYSFNFLLLQILVYSFFGWYFDAISEFNNRGFCFFLSPSYWRSKSIANKRRRKMKNVVGHLFQGKTLGGVPDPLVSPLIPNISGLSETITSISSTLTDSKIVPLEVEGLNKTFSNKVVALKNVSFTTEMDELVCILGHNGAGKSSLINILAGTIEATSGDAKICGVNLFERKYVQPLVGVCFQTDILWSELTAYEHLRLFGLLKGIPQESLEAEIKKQLDSVSLFDVKDAVVNTYSGGMKRRLSVAVATMGDPKVILLDEPTAGMDVLSRRQVWEMLENMKVGRSIIITSHNMEEVDVLADKVIIMAGGEIREIENPLRLRTKYGAGYNIKISSDFRQYTDLLDEIVSDLANVSYVQSSNFNAIISVPSTSVESLPLLIERLQTPGIGENINEWNIAYTSLEEVFFQVTAQSGPLLSIPFRPRTDTSTRIAIDMYKDRDGGGITKRRNTGGGGAVTIQKAKYSSIFCALWIKLCLLQMRQYKMNLCQLAGPVLVMVILLLIQTLIRTQLSPNVLVPLPSIPIPMDVIQDDFVSGDCYSFFLFADGTHNKQGEEITSLFNQEKCILNSTNIINVPFFEKRISDAVIEDELYKDLLLLNKVHNSDLNIAPPCDAPQYLNCPDHLLPDATVFFSKVETSINSSLDANEGKIYSLHYSMRVNDNRNARYHRPNNFTRLGVINFPEALAGNGSLIISQGKLAMADRTNNAFHKYVGKPKPSPPSGLPPNLKKFLDIILVNYGTTMKEVKVTSLSSLVEFFNSFLFPLAFCLQLPVHIYLIVLEKETKLLTMQQVMGVDTKTYYFVTFVFNFFTFGIITAVFWSLGLILQLRFFTQTDNSILILFFVGWGLTLVSLGLFISLFILSRRAAVVVGYCFVLFGVLLCLVISDGIYTPFYTNAHFPTIFYIFPFFSLVRGVYKINYQCILVQDCYTLKKLTIHDELSTALIAMYIMSLFLIIVSVYLERVLPKPYGVRKGFCFCCEKFRKSIYQLDANTLRNRSRSSSYNGMSAVRIDMDVKAEMIRATNSEPKDWPLLVQNLSKVFENEDKKKKRAVDNISLTIQRGECFGLLGVNGSGKSTLINLLCGLYSPTSGDAFISGHHITREFDLVQQTIGLCPQQDLLWEDLTVEEHLYFYSRIKGVSPGMEKEHVTTSLKEVHLYEVRKIFASQLSGGMRRRLSLAIALIGNSSVIFLDEPSKDLDPISRRQIWSILENAKQSRLLVICTHTMEEAEYLCSRIGILVRGQLRAVGSQQRLRIRYAIGWRLSINYNVLKEQQASEFITKYISGAVLQSKIRGRWEYKIVDSSNIPNSFVALHKYAADAGIIDWMVGQMSLTDIFNSVIKASADEREDPFL